MLEAAVADGVTFFDTADVYGDGRSEQVIGEFLARDPTRHHRRDQDGSADGAGARRTTRWPTSGPGPTGRGATSGSTRSTWSSCTARRPR